MLLSSPTPFREALLSRAVKEILPTSMSSAELMALDAAVRERAMFSAQTLNEGYLQEISDRVEKILNPVSVTRTDTDGHERTRTEGLDVATARTELKEQLRRIGYQPEPEKRGSLEDLSSDGRLNLIIKTNTEMAQGYGSWRQGQDPAVLDEFPAQELFRAEERKEPRDWVSRWRGAGGELYDGRMIALKNDPIWTEISAFGVPYPPFDFNSGMWVQDVDRDEAVSLGLIDADTQIEPQSRGFEMKEEG